MKKIIAAAVATAFVAPAFAADVTVSGDIDYIFQSADGVNSFSATQQDLIVSASETLANGIGVSAYISVEGADGANDNHDTLVTLTGGFGELSIGDDADAGYNAFDNKTDVASTGGDSEISSGGTTVGGIQYKPATGIEGLELAIGYAANTSSTAGEESGYGIQYSVGGVSVAYYAADVDGQAQNTSGVSASFATGPLYLAVDSYKKLGGVDGDNATTVAGTYKLGASTLFIERTTTEDDTNVDATDTTYGVEYDMGAIDLYVVQIEDETAGASAVTIADKTRVGIEYKF